MLGDDATAQFSAGILYGAKEGAIDERDYIVGCSSHHDNLDNMLMDIFNHYEADQIDAANNKMLEALPFFKLSMAMCPKTNPDFEKWYDDLHNFRARDDQKDLWTANYQANKE